MRNKYKFYILNHIIYNLYNFDNFEETKLQMLEDLAFVVPNCCASLFMTNPEDDSLLCDPLCHPPNYVQMEKEYLKENERSFCRWITRRRYPFVVRASDLMDEEEYEAMAYYKHYFEPYGVYHMVYVTIAWENQTLGVLVLYRKKEEDDFDETDIFWLQILSEHLNLRFSKEARAKEKSGDNAPDEFQWIQSYNLTLRESEIVGQILRMKPNMIICEEMGISSNTLKKHLQNIYRKMGIKNKTELLTVLKSNS